MIVRFLRCPIICTVLNAVLCSWTSFLNVQSFYWDFLHSSLLCYERLSYSKLKAPIPAVLDWCKIQHIIIYCSCCLLSGSFLGIGGSYFDIENRIILNTIDCFVEWRYLKKGGPNTSFKAVQAIEHRKRILQSFVTKIVHATAQMSRRKVIRIPAWRAHTSSLVVTTIVRT